MDDKANGASSYTLKHLLIIAIILCVAGLVAWAGGQGGISVAGWPLLVMCAVYIFAIQWLVFIPAWLYQTEHYFDLTGSLTYISTVLIALFFSSEPDVRGILLAALVCIWAVRLGSFLFLRIKQDGNDGRFDDIKPVFTRFLMTWTLQGLWVFLTLSAALTAMTTELRLSMDVLAYAGLLLWLLGFGVEAVADAQKRQFRKDPANKGRFINSGLWAWSRHPNYFGEILLWAGIALIAVHVLSGWQWFTLISPVFVYVLLTRVSGIPMLEARAEKRWGQETEYQDYKTRTSRLLLRPPKTRV